MSNVLKSGLSEPARRAFVQGRIGAANAAEFFGVLRDLSAGADVPRLLAAARGPDTVALLPRTLDGLYGMIYGLVGASTDQATIVRALEVAEELPGVPAPLPAREGQTLLMELLMQKALATGLELAVLDSPAYRRYTERRRREGLDA